MSIIYYTYFRIYSWYKKNQLTTVPETYAGSILSFMFIFAGLLACYWLVRLNYVAKPNDTALAVFIIVFFVTRIIVGKWMKNTIGESRRKWQKEQGVAKKVKGYLIALFALASFIGVFAIASAFHKLGLGKR